MRPFIIIIVFLTSLTLYQANYFTSIEKIKPENCQKISSMQGPEDIDSAGSDLLVSISNLVEDITQWKQGGIASYNIISKKSEILTNTFTRKLNIHGIKVVKNKNNSWKVYAINHKRIKDEILIFLYKNKKLELIEVISSLEIYNLNDIEVLKNGTIIVTKDHYFKNMYMKRIENFLRIGLSKILYYDSNKFTQLNPNFTFANGITLINETTIAVASMLNKKIDLFNIEDISNIKKIKSIKLDFFPDNLNYNKKTNTLFVAGHYKIFKLLQHSINPSQNVSPSKGISIDLNSMKQKVLLAEDSLLFSGLSVIKEMKDKYYFGFIYQDYILECSK